MDDGTVPFADPLGQGGQLLRQPVRRVRIVDERHDLVAQVRRQLADPLAASDIRPALEPALGLPGMGADANGMEGRT